MSSGVVAGLQSAQFDSVEKMSRCVKMNMWTLSVQLWPAATFWGLETAHASWKTAAFCCQSPNEIRSLCLFFLFILGETHLFHLIIAALWILLLFCSFSFMELIFLTLILNPMFFFWTAQTHSVLCKAVWIAWMKKRKTHEKLLYLAFGLMNNKKCLNSVWQILIKSTHT